MASDLIKDLEAQKMKIDMLSAQKATNDFYKNRNTDTTRPANKYTTKFDEVRLRLAQIDNYELDRSNGVSDPLDITKVVNMNTGKVTLRWMYYNGGQMKSSEFAYPSDGYTEDWNYDSTKDSKYPEDRTLDCYNHDKASDRETVQLTHAFLWSNSNNWCGMNYLPPVGSIVVVGFARDNKPLILGYLNNSYETCKPYLKPGEIMMKGYGNNYIHWRQSNKLDIFAGCTNGEIDIDDPSKTDTYDGDIELWARFNSYTRNILIEAIQKNGTTSSINIMPENIKILSGSSYVNISNNNIILSSNNISLSNTSISNLECSNINASSISIGNSSSGNKTNIMDEINSYKNTIAKQNTKIKKLENELEKIKKFINYKE